MGCASSASENDKAFSWDNGDPSHIIDSPISFGGPHPPPSPTRGEKRRVLVRATSRPALPRHSRPTSKDTDEWRQATPPALGGVDVDVATAPAPLGHFPPTALQRELSHGSLRLLASVGSFRSDGARSHTSMRSVADPAVVESLLGLTARSTYSAQAFGSRAASPRPSAATPCSFHNPLRLPNEQ